jgi:hypothetical protein
MEPKPDHSNSDHPSAATVASEERIYALIAEKEQLANDLAQAKSAIEASERELADGRQKIQELTAERDPLAADKTPARSAREISERDLVALKSQVLFLSGNEAGRLFGRLSQSLRGGGKLLWLAVPYGLWCGANLPAYVYKRPRR